MDTKFSLRKIRKLHYKEQIKKLGSLGTDINNFFSNPYTFFKSRYYIEVSSFLVFFLQFSKIPPNFITSIYIVLSLSVLFLLSSNNEILILTSIIILFTKGVLDWSDGLLARIKNKTSNLGFLLDNWASLISSYSYLLGLSIYIYNKDNEIIFLAAGVFIVLLKALDIRNYGYLLAMYALFKEKNKQNILKKLNFEMHFKKTNSKRKSLVQKAKIFIQGFLDERSRSVDFVCLLILIDTFFYSSDILKYLYFLILIKNLIIFGASFYYVSNKGYIFKND